MPHMRSATLSFFIASLFFTTFAFAQTSAQNALQSQVDQIASQHHGQVSVYAKDLKTGQTIALKADEPVQTASVIKLAILYEAMEQIRAGKTRWNDKETLTK